MIYILGSNGQLGSELKRSEWLKGATFLDRSQCDLANLDMLEKFLQESKITTLINAAAFTQVDKAESEKTLAQTINESAPTLMARYAQKKKFKLVHFSTDYVFDGHNFKPYVEDDLTNPVNFYGETKLNGETGILKECDSSLIIRTSWVYSSFGANFLKTMLRLGQSGNPLRVVFDQVGTPTYASDLANIIHPALKRDLKGIFHFSNEGVTSWYDFAKAIFEVREMTVDVQPIHGFEYPAPAKRPHYSVLDKTKLKTALDCKIPHWKEALERCVRDMN